MQFPTMVDQEVSPDFTEMCAKLRPCLRAWTLAATAAQTVLNNERRLNRQRGGGQGGAEDAAAGGGHGARARAPGRQRPRAVERAPLHVLLSAVPAVSRCGPGLRPGALPCLPLDLSPAHDMPLSLIFTRPHFGAAGR